MVPALHTSFLLMNCILWSKLLGEILLNYNEFLKIIVINQANIQKSQIHFSQKITPIIKHQILSMFHIPVKEST